MPDEIAFDKNGERTPQEGGDEQSPYQEEEQEKEQEQEQDVKFTEELGMGNLTTEQAMMFQPNAMLGENSTENGGGEATSNAADMIDQLPSEFIYTEIFKAFDQDNRGVITQDDLNLSASAAGWKPDQVQDLIQELDPGHKGEFNMEEFNLIMKYIETKNEPQN
jgi:hypothetical protein